MLRSYICQAMKGDVILRREVLSQLGVGSDGLLYGALNAQEGTAILSPIPPAYWDKAFKIIVHTREVAGSAADAADRIAELGLSTISSWASNESSKGHLCCTFIVVGDDQTMLTLGGPEGITTALRNKVHASLSDLPVYHSGGLAAVRVTPLSILAEYRTQIGDDDFYDIPISHHRLKMDQRLVGKSLWSILAQTSSPQGASACILTPDTEEAVLRVSVISESARLFRMVFRLFIRSGHASFAGYWQHALGLIAANHCSVYVAHNLLISKSEDDSTETAEFHFVIDRRRSKDLRFSFMDLTKVWEERLTRSYQEFAASRGDVAEAHDVRISRTRGAGIPCFFASNAKPRDGVGAAAAAELCQLLEGHGFKPISVNLAEGGKPLRAQVAERVRACRFMVVLYCPEERLRRPDGKFGVSEWVIFEEGVMEACGGDIMRLKFESVAEAACNPGYLGMNLSADGVDHALRERVSSLLKQWHVAWGNQEDGRLSGIDENWLDIDLVNYYLGTD